MSRRRRIGSLTFGSILAALSSSAIAATIYVPGNYATIQGAIDAANNGDIIVVSEGTYEENIDFGGKDIVVKSTDPEDAGVVADTVVDGGQQASVVTFDGTETSDAQLRGFTITNGNSEYGGGILGGDSNDATQATIANCVVKANWSDHGAIAFCNGSISKCAIVDNHIGTYRAGLYMCDGDISECIVAANDGDGLYDCDGDITYCIVAGNGWTGLSYCDGTISNCTITGNGGSGLYECPLVENCVIAGNTGSAGTGPLQSGGGIWSSALDLVVRNSLIAGNRAPLPNGCGGGIAHVNNPLGGPCTVAVTGCTLWGNEANDLGGGVYLETGWLDDPLTEGSITNCILYNNAALLEIGPPPGVIGGHEVALLGWAEGSTLTISYSDVQEGDPESVYSPHDWAWSLTNSIDADPVFVDAPSGTWSADGFYDPNDPAYVVFTDASKDWTPHSLAGKLINPDTDQRLQFVIADNAATTVTAWADSGTIDDDESWVLSSAAYQIHDYHLTDESPCIDVGTNNPLGGLGSTDIDGQTRSVDGDGDQTAVVDIGADEYMTPGLHEEEGDPGADGTLPKTQNNVILLVFDEPIVVPPGVNPVTIRPLEEGGPGDDIADDFAFTVSETVVRNDTLKCKENGSKLTNMTWYRVEPTSDFMVDTFQLDVCTLQGDADGNGTVLAQDYWPVQNHLFEKTDARYDLDGNGQVLAQDYYVVYNHLFNTKPSKP